MSQGGGFALRNEKSTALCSVLVCNESDCGGVGVMGCGVFDEGAGW